MRRMRKLMSRCDGLSIYKHSDTQEKKLHGEYIFTISNKKEIERSRRRSSNSRGKNDSTRFT